MPDRITLDQLRLTVEKKYGRSFVWVSAQEKGAAGVSLTLWLLVGREYKTAQFTWYKSASDVDLRKTLSVRKGSTIVTNEAADSVAMVLLEWEVEKNAVDVKDVLNGTYPVFGSSLLESDLVWEVPKARPRVQSGFHYVEEAGFGVSQGVVISYSYGFTPYNPSEEWGTAELAVFYVTEYQDGTLWIQADDPLDAFSLDVYVTNNRVYKGKGALKHKDVISAFCSWYWERGREQYFK